jgi:hypothetical protein
MPFEACTSAPRRIAPVGSVTTPSIRAPFAQSLCPNPKAGASDVPKKMTTFDPKCTLDGLLTQCFREG